MVVRGSRRGGEPGWGWLDGWMGEGFDLLIAWLNRLEEGSEWDRFSWFDRRAFID